MELRLFKDIWTSCTLQVLTSRQMFRGITTGNETNENIKLRRIASNPDPESFHMGFIVGGGKTPALGPSKGKTASGCFIFKLLVQFKV